MNDSAALGVLGAEAKRLNPATEMAAAHIAQGSSVTHKVHSSRRDVPSVAAAARIASISACAVGSTDPRMAFRASATISSPQRDDSADRHFARGRSLRSKVERAAHREWQRKVMAAR